MIIKMKQQFLNTAQHQSLSSKLVIAVSAIVLGLSLHSLAPKAAFAAPQLQQQQQQAQQINSVEATVNDQPITTFDVNERLYFMIAISGGVANEEELAKLREQVVESMINEILQLQEASKYKADITPPELEDYFARRAQMIGSTPTQFEEELKRIGSSKRSFLRQIEAELAWERIVDGLLGDQVTVLDEEVESTINRIKANKGKSEYRLSEILLLVNNANQEASIKQYADQMVASLRSNGVKFEDIARQISASSTAAIGGDLGWVLRTDLDPELDKVIDTMDIESISDPIRTAGSYRIYKLIDRRKVLSADKNDTLLTLKQAMLPAAMVTAEPAKLDAFRTMQTRLAAKDDACDMIVEEAKALKLPGNAEIGKVQIKSLPGQLRNTLKDIETGKPTDVLSDAQGHYVFVVCGRTIPEIPEPDFDAIMGQMQAQRLAVRARRHLRDLRRDAIIDMR